MKLRPGKVHQRIKLDTLVRLRWMAVAGQIVTLLTVTFGFGYPLPLTACLAVVAVSALLNLGLKIRYPASRRLADRWATLMLAYDICQLSALLFLTGGLGNPFVILLLAPVVVSATALGLRSTLLLGGLVTLLITGLAFGHLPLPWGDPTGIPVEPGYLAGLWVALVAALSFMAAYSWRVAEEARQLQAALSATELLLSREQHANQLDGLAAATAHELGTPLATIALVAKELLRQVPEDAPMREDLALLQSQSQRCREILRRLTSLSGEFHAHLHQVPISHLIEDIVAPHRDAGVDVAVTLDGDKADEPSSPRNPAVVHGIANIVENAVDFARTRVDVRVSWNEERVSIAIVDDGPGFSADIIDRIGEPYVTTRKRGSEEELEEEEIGLGFFVAKTLLERTGARLQIRNRAAPQTGAFVEIRWPRSAYVDRK
ncbi:Sensor histidine kinase RegB [Hartmannibacter diazotrophicus]|uniref:histidine kinase n=1 Tax=Hartmannibacter diazotrophicus TaxID=1482074 RepID=A0A2C9DDA6_9HYPH|nr:ActS/PrrB/RegB family redox-sensitive histidine kinase [Hartmannibacter diazotrophicus]SON58287.1 Sensor histidine kinase RegB [Hartmannibacter diazotrophicus]